MENIEYLGNRSNLPEGFGMIIPQGPYRPPKEPFFKLWREFGYWHFKIRIPRYPKWLDRLLKPLCKHGLHRWIGTFGFKQYSYKWGDATSWEIKNEHNFQCARCKKTKSVPVK